MASMPSELFNTWVQTWADPPPYAWSLARNTWHGVAQSPHMMASDWWDTWIQLWADTPPSILAVMAVGVLVGSLAQSITGFGSVIAHLCVWSVAKAAGINVGSLRQSIVTEAVYRAVMAIPYMFLTRAHKTADIKLAVSFSTFSALGCSIGVWLLLILDQRVTELCLAGVLCLLLLAQAAAFWLQRPKPINKLPDSTALLSSQPDLEEPLLKHEYNQSLVVPELSSILNAQWPGKKGTELSASPEPSVFSSSDFDDNAHVELVAPAGGPPDASSSGIGLLAGVGYWRQWVVLLAAGSVAGTLSGVMGGLTGVGGPPMIIMYNVLRAEKATVRGTNAITSCVSVAVILLAYVAGGAFAWQDTPRYVTGAAFGVVGTLWGNSLSHRMSQATFVRVLNLMIVVCAGLMLLSGLGLVGN